MSRKLLLLTLLCFTAATLLAAGCGDKDKPADKDKDKAGKPEPGPVGGAPEVTPPEVKPPEVKPPEKKPPEVKPPEVKPPEVKPPEVKPPEVKPPEVKPPEKKPPEVKPPEKKPPEVKPPEKKPPEAKPAAGKKFPGMWADAKVGTMVKMKIVATKGTKTDEVIKCDKDTVTIRTTMAMPNVPAGAIKPTERTVKRYETVDPVTGKVPDNVKVKKLPDKTLSVAGKDYKCEVHESVVTVAG